MSQRILAVQNHYLPELWSQSLIFICEDYGVNQVRYAFEMVLKKINIGYGLWLWMWMWNLQLFNNIGSFFLWWMIYIYYETRLGD